MQRCPQCTKPLEELSRRCPYCMANLDLLVDYATDLQGGLQRAQQYTRSGELGRAVWSYLEVLEVDPDNPSARQQVGQVATAVRQFDRVVPGRRWHNGSPSGLFGEATWGKLFVGFLGFFLLVTVTAFLLGYGLGRMNTPESGSAPSTEIEKPGHKAQPLGGSK